MLCGGLIGLLFVAAHQRLSKIPGLGPAIPVMLCALAAMLAQGLTLVLPQQSPFISAFDIKSVLDGCCINALL